MKKADKAFAVVELEEDEKFIIEAIDDIIDLSIYQFRNDITSLVFVNCEELKELNCRDSRITELDLSGLCGLVVLICGENKITNLDVSNNEALKHLQCDHNCIERLNLQHNSLLRFL